MVKAARTHITRAEADEFDALTPLVVQMHKDFQELTKKKQDGAVSPSRIMMVNRLLERAKQTLARESSSPLLDLLDADLVPQNADAMLVIGQYVAALEGVRKRYQEDEFGTISWKLKG
jgi:hypothetical protein